MQQQHGDSNATVADKDVQMDKQNMAEKNDDCSSDTSSESQDKKVGESQKDQK